MKHTEGPWKTAHYCKPPHVYEHTVVTTEAVCTGFYLELWGHLMPLEERQANAHLIAAAPEMLDVLYAALENIELTYGHYHPEGRHKDDLSSSPKLIETIKATIKNAEGEK